MDCTKCNTKKCRKTEACNALQFDANALMEKYHLPDNQEIIRAAAQLVDNGRAGTLSRLQEIIEFSRSMKFQRIGLAYCYGMEQNAALVANILRNSGFKTVPVSCTAGGFKQLEVNSESSLHGVSCNPLAQAEQLNQENVDLTISMGLCLGHDLLFQKQIKTYTTTLLVKDRVYNHNPVEELIN